MAALPVHAFGFAATFRLPEIARVFEGAWVRGDRNKDRLVVRFAGESLEQLALLYDFGAVVFVGLDRDACDRHVQAITAALPAEPHPALEEHFLLEEEPAHRAPEVLFDRVLLPQLTLPTLDIVGLLLAQSVVMDYYEEDVQDAMRRTGHITDAMQTRGRIPGRVRQLGQFIGTCMALRNDILATLALFDKPESTWEDPQLDRLYEDLRIEFEIEDRFRGLEKRLGMIQDNLVLFIEVSQARSAWRLELTIVLLIVFEILMSLWNQFAGTGQG